MNEGIDEGRDDNTKLSEPAGIAPAKGDMSPADDGILEWPVNSGATAGALGWLPLNESAANELPPVSNGLAPEGLQFANISFAKRLSS